MWGCSWKLTLSDLDEEMCRLAALVHTMNKNWGCVFFTSFWGVALVMHCDRYSRRNERDSQQMSKQIAEVVYAVIQLQGLMKYGLIYFKEPLFLWPFRKVRGVLMFKAILHGKSDHVFCVDRVRTWVFFTIQCECEMLLFWSEVMKGLRMGNEADRAA